MAVSSLLIGVTRFFRDRAVFNRMRKDVMPVLSEGGRPLRVWSAGCSTGAELYSMAILLAELGLLTKTFLLGTDFRDDAIEYARTGTYDAKVKGLTPAEIDRWFGQEGKTVRPAERLRARIRWKQANWLTDAEKGPWDIILWRNAAIYLTAEAAFAVWARLHGQLRKGGFMITGKAERPPWSLGMHMAGQSIYQKAGV